MVKGNQQRPLSEMSSELTAEPLSKDDRRKSSQNSSGGGGDTNPSPLILEMEPPPPSDAEKDTEKELERIIGKVNRLQTKFSIMLYTGFITPFWLILFMRYGHSFGHWIWLLTFVIYSPIVIYILGTLCCSFCVTKPLTPAELAYLQENED